MHNEAYKGDALIKILGDKDLRECWGEMAEAEKALKDDRLPPDHETTKELFDGTPAAYARLQSRAVSLLE